MLKGYFRGIKAYAGTFGIIYKLGLWRYFFVPIILSVFIAFLIGFSAWGLSDNLGGWIAQIWPWEWGSHTFRTVSDVLGGLAIITLGLIAYKHIVMALSAPFMGAVSEKIEAHFHEDTSNKSQSSFIQLLWRGIRVNLRNLLMELLLSIPILIIGFIPFVGFISTPLLFLVQAYYAGFGNMDYTLERHLDYARSIPFVKSNRGIAMGNGTIFMLLLLVPVLGLILVLPLSVTAASVSTLELLHPKKTPSV
ncbi:MAG TPA: EI24 domain-containing protein [Flavobacteriaceae bacterium]|nr:EI24 domain-containing protein [Flavobacteriaceae bacterium]MCB9212039.1 EI24 domain-containing protein [Alteromonas sp.]HPF09866.1 EI24 domain-containing protein [Flavobacteriaceae bacterium]HQU19963.1 EI24 domain-containing protein [Flavobacteriaceae bacterium]HQU64051.1 EI24 domain-containing protein [Flavobacteriaceae bacterium]